MKASLVVFLYLTRPGAGSQGYERDLLVDSGSGGTHNWKYTPSRRNAKYVETNQNLSPPALDILLHISLHCTCRVSASVLKL